MSIWTTRRGVGVPLGIDNQIPMRGYGNVLVVYSFISEELVLLAFLGHSAYRVMVLYASVGPRGPGVSIAARRTPQE